MQSEDSNLFEERESAYSKQLKVTHILSTSSYLS